MKNIKIGQEAKISKAFSAADVISFSNLSLDKNPVHLDKEFAKKTLFEKLIVHGYLYGSLISAVIGTKLPGPGSIYLNQEMNFKKPVYLNEEVMAVVKVVDIKPEKSLIFLSTNCYVNEKEIVIEGSAVIKLI